MIKLRSIRARSVLYTFMIMMVPLLILGAAGTLYFHNAMKKNSENTFLGGARAVSDLTDNYMDKAVLYLQGQADRALLIEAVDRHDNAALQDNMKRIIESTPTFYWAFITDPAGNVLASYPYDGLTGMRLDYSRQAPEPLWTGKGNITNPVTSDISGRSTIFVSTPIASNGTTTGFLVGGMDIEYYYAMLNRARASVPGQCIFVVNDTGQMVAHHDPGVTHAITDVSPLAPVQRVIRGEEGAMEYDDPVSGGRWLGAYAFMPKYRWGVIVAQPTADAYRPISDAMKALAALLALLAFLSIPIAIVAGNYIARPINRISQAASHVGEDIDVSKYLPYDRDDELGQLAHSFRSMSDRIMAVREKLQEEKTHADMYIDVMGHDINNLNQIIMSNLELVEYYDHLNDKQTEYLEGAVLAMKDSAEIVKNVKAIQAITAEKQELRPVDLDQMLQECFKGAPRPGKKQVTVNYEPREGRIVNALPELRLAFCSVINNSIKYSGPEVRIDVSIDEETRDGKKHYVTAIADNGNGIPDDVRETLFTRFRKDAKVRPGKGLGLYTAKALAEAFGGTLKVECRVPDDYTKGTKVIIALPAAEDA